VPLHRAKERERREFAEAQRRRRADRARARRAAKQLLGASTPLDPLPPKLRKQDVIVATMIVVAEVLGAIAIAFVLSSVLR
jgi:hypothetical protein